MALKTVQLDTGKLMANLTKLLWRIDRYKFSRAISLNMAVYTFVQAMFFGSDTLVHRLITLVQ
jgi:hypothetical protein